MLFMPGQPLSARLVLSSTQPPMVQATGQRSAQKARPGRSRRVLHRRRGRPRRRWSGRQTRRGGPGEPGALQLKIAYDVRAGATWPLMKVSGRYHCSGATYRRVRNRSRTTTKTPSNPFTANQTAWQARRVRKFVHAAALKLLSLSSGLDGEGRLDRAGRPVFRLVLGRDGRWHLLAVSLPPGPAVEVLIPLGGIDIRGLP